MQKLNDSLLIEAVARDTGLNQSAIRLVIEQFNRRGYEVTKRRTHSDVHLPSIPSVLEGDR